MKIKMSKNEIKAIDHSILTCMLNTLESTEDEKEKDKVIQNFSNLKSSKLKNFESENLNIKIEDDGSIEAQLSEDLTSDLSLTAANIMLKLYKLTRIIDKKFEGEDHAILEFFEDSIESEISTLTNKYPEIKIESKEE